MYDYSIALFLHIVGALGFFVAVDLHPDSGGHRPGDRLSQDRQARLGRVTAHRWRSNRARLRLSSAYATP